MMHGGQTPAATPAAIAGLYMPSWHACRRPLFLSDIASSRTRRTHGRDNAHAQPAREKNGQSENCGPEMSLGTSSLLSGVDLAVTEKKLIAEKVQVSIQALRMYAVYTAYTYLKE